MAENPSIPVALALGSNLGDRLTYLKAAVKTLGACVDIKAVSSVYETSPAYVVDQPVFLNAVVLGTTKLEPLPLLWNLKNIEREIGRTPTFRYGPRVIDIDVVFYDDLLLKTPELNLPHAHMHERDFVLKPLGDVAPTWRHPVLRQTPAEMLANLPKSNMACLGALLT